MKLLDESSSSSEDEQPQDKLKINQKFASEYERNQRYKDLQRSKDLLAMDGLDEEDSESDESEDDDAELLSPGLDLKIIQTINQIRKKDPKIYDKNVKFFEKPAADDDSDNEEEKHKKKRYKDVLREQLLEGGADMASSDEEDKGAGKRRQQETVSKKDLVYDREQEDIRKAFLNAAKGSDVDDSEEEEGQSNLLSVKKKSAAELAKEEEELKKALQEMKTLAKDDDAEKEDFLATYFTNKMWKDTADKKKSSADSSDEDFEQDEDALEEAELFESKYNFRFEEMQDEKERREKAGNIIGASDTAYQVVGHARNVQGSLRRLDDSRKVQREQRKERKDRERRQKEEELKRLKNLKKQELQERLSKIGEMGGLKQMGIDEGFLDEDWDPAKHEALMQQQFNDDYYQEDDENFSADKMDDELGNIIGDEGEVDGEYYDNAEEGYAEEEAPEDPRAHFASEEEYLAAKGAVNNMMNELYQLDYEDIVAGIPCRFKYKQVEPEDFGLSADEILLADDADLNRFVSLKHIAPYQPNKWNKSDRDISKRRKRLRLTIQEKLKGQEVPEVAAAGEERSSSKKKSKKEDNKPVAEETEEAEEEVNTGDAEQQKHKRKRRKRKNDGEGADAPAVQVISKATEPEYKPAVVAKEAAAAAAAAPTEEKKKFRDNKKKNKTNKKKKEETDPAKKRLNLYN